MPTLTVEQYSGVAKSACVKSVHVDYIVKCQSEIDNISVDAGTYIAIKCNCIGAIANRFNDITWYMWPVATMLNIPMKCMITLHTDYNP